MGESEEIGVVIGRAVDRLVDAGLWDEKRSADYEVHKEDVVRARARLRRAGEKLTSNPGNQRLALLCVAAIRENFRAFANFLETVGVDGLARRYRAAALLEDRELAAVCNDLDSLEIETNPRFDRG
ncbi:hypothetical protein [uncultured Jatrophihabitans sp.]|uniref:hypothetical protein n=1 Tax=uncultured Jatrophihabitans sp. TaxID=1610747 RepID=UPI0035CB956C